MNVAYTIWLESLNSPILRTQVIKVLKRITKIFPEDKIYLFSFQPIYTILLHYQEIHKIRKDLMSNKINLILIPSLTIPKLNWFNAKWYIIPLIFIQSFPVLLLLILTKKIDILHCRSYPITLSAIVVKKLTKVRVMFDPRSPFPEENITAGRWSEDSLSCRIWRYLEKKYLKESDITVAIASTYVRHFREISPYSNLIIIPNNVDVTKFIPDYNNRKHLRLEMGIGDDEIIFVYSGSLGNHWNNPNIYAKFIIKLRKLNIKHRFLFITPNISELKKTFDRCNIKPDGYFAISVDLDDVPRYLSVADFGLNLMERQDIRMSIKTSEYLAMGLPIIINSNVLGAKEIVEQYGVGLVLEDLGNINLKELENFIQKRDQFSFKCRKVACERFSTIEVAKQYWETYKKLKRE